MKNMPPSSDSLKEFFNRWKEQRSTDAHSNFTDNISQVFQQFDLHRGRAFPKASPAQKSFDIQKLAHLLKSLEKPLEASRHSASAFNPWDVIRLGRNEVRVVSILSWLLNPRGSHGFGSALLSGLLTGAVQPSLKDQNRQFPTHAGKYCRVRTEINPNGESGDRVDIEIDSENFYLIIEAKIDAPEQSDQLKRYCRQGQNHAKQHACPWAVIYLTPQGLEPSSADNLENIVCLSWNRLSRILHEHMKNDKSFVKAGSDFMQSNANFFVKTYLNHIQAL